VSDHLYVATGADGIERSAGGEIVWRLPDDSAGTAGESVTASVPLVLRRSKSLLDALDERVYRVEALDAPKDLGDEVEATSARLVSRAHWDTDSAARFAIDCAEHALEGAPNAALPDGEELAPILAGARLVLERDERGSDERLGFLARLSAVRRLRRIRDSLSDAILASTTKDLGDDLDVVDDPKWATLAAGQEAVLAALEAVRHVALPRYVRSREEAVDEHPGGEPRSSSPVVMTPWGAVALGAEHQSPYVPAWTAARDAAIRAREAARDRSGEEAGSAELAWQARRLEEILETN
jgi:hypothetical protein